MGIQPIYEEVFGFRWAANENADVRALITKLFKYKNQAGYKNDSLGLTKRDREIIKQMYESFVPDAESQ